MFDFSIDKQSPIPYYYQIQEWIRGLITQGRLQPGDRLLSENKLCEQLGVSRVTIRQALGNLVNEGLLLRDRPRGTFVAPQRRQIPFTLNQLSGLTQDLARRGLTVRSRVLDQHTVPATANIMRNLQLNWNEPVILIRRIRVVADIPLVIETSYHPYRRFPELLTMDLNDRSIYEILDKEYDALPQEALDNFIASVATEQEASLLNINVGDPVMRYERVAMDKNGQPTEYTRSVYRADQYQFIIRYRRSPADE